MKHKILWGATAALVWVLMAPVTGPAPAQTASPTDGRIAYTGHPTGDNEEPTDIFVMNADGTDVTNLTNTPQIPESQPAWSPDGTQILYKRTEPKEDEPEVLQSDIFVMDADGSQPTNLTQSDDTESWPSWAPTADRIAFIREVPGPIVGNHDVFTMQIGNPDSATNVTNTDWDELFPAWSPVDERIMFTGVRDADPDPDPDAVRGDWEILTINSNGTNEQNLTASDNGGHEDWAPDWSPDGTKIVWMAQVNCCETNEQEQWDVWAMNSDGTGRSNLTQNPAGDWFPSWSSDGSGIVFSSNRATGWSFDIYTIPAPETLPLEPPGSEEGAMAALLTPTAEARGLPARRVTSGEDVSDPDWWLKLECTHQGTKAGETIEGSSGDDVICGRRGRDIIHAGPGNDVVLSGPEGDEVRGGSGDDLISLGTGSDVTRGGPDSDVLRGSRGRDQLNSRDETRRNDTLFGGDGPDTCRIDKGDFRDSCF